MLKRRATLVRSRTQLQQSLTDLDPLQNEVDALLTQCERTIRKMDQACMRWFEDAADLRLSAEARQ